MTNDFTDDYPSQAGPTRRPTHDRRVRRPSAPATADRMTTTSTTNRKDSPCHSCSLTPN